MELSSKGAAFTRAHEGFKAQAYLDPVGILTIGIGFTWRSNAFRKWWAIHRPGQTFSLKSTMTREEAEECLRFMFKEEYGKAVNDFLSREVPQHIFDGMASPVFNLGAGSLKWQWAQAAKAGDYRRAGLLLTTTGTTAQGKTLSGLVKRRADEAELIIYGDYTYGPMRASPAAVAEANALSDGVLVRGERGPAVALLIQDLKKLGFYDGTVDDIFGYGTEAAVLAFQRANGLRADGKAGPKTLAAIAEKLKAKPAPAKAAVATAAVVTVTGTAALWPWLSNLPCQLFNVFCGG